MRVVRVTEIERDIEDLGVGLLQQGGRGRKPYPTDQHLVGDPRSSQVALQGPSNAHAEQVGGHVDVRIRRLKGMVGVPVISSLNGVTPGGWLRYARLMEKVGADALELNVYALATDAREDARTLEDRTIEMVREVRRSVRIPLAVKLSPFYTSFANFAHRLDEAGPAGLVLFNRFWQPGIDVEELEVRRELRLSDSCELPLRLRWLAILSGNVHATLAVTGGVHTVLDVIQVVMAGAHAVQMVSALLRHGPEYLAVVRRELGQWLEEYQYGSLREMRGSMSMRRCPDPQAYERANYMLMLQSGKPVNGA